MRRCCYCCILVLLPSIAVRAQPQISGSDEAIVVTASRLQSREASAVSSVSVLDEAKIDARNAASLVELIRQLPGLHVAQQGGRGGLNTTFVRGAESNFTVVMIDGVQVNDLLNARGASHDLSTVDHSGITRIELVRGPLSSIYGSNALGGVLQLFTTGASPGREATVQLGSDDLASATLRITTESEAYPVTFGVHMTRDDGDIEGSTHKDYGAFASGRADLNASSSLVYSFRYQAADSTSFPENSGGAALATIRTVESRESEDGHLRLAYRRNPSRGWHTEIAASRYVLSEGLVSPGIAPGLLPGVPASTVDSEFIRNQLTASARRAIGERVSVGLGAEWQRESGDSQGTLDFGLVVPVVFELDRDTASAFSEFEMRFARLAIAASTRYDRVDAIESEISSRFGAIYRFDRFEIRANWAEGFKAPSFFALTHPLVGNPALRSEFATNLEVGFAKTLSSNGARLSLDFFENEYTDLVDFDSVLFQVVNRSSAVTNGFELEVSWPFSNTLNLDTFVSRANAEVRGEAARLSNRPKWRSGVVVDWRINERLRMSASALTVDEFFETSIPTSTILLDGYRRVDISLSWQTRPSYFWRFAIDNLLDASYEETVGFPGPGIRARIGLNLTF